MSTDVFNQTGQKVSQVDLPKEVFQAVVNPAVVAQAIRVRLMNAKAGTASTKTRAEVRGGGRKPWRQKGTGRARQGSIRAPQWVGGGIVHGPRPHKPEQQMPQSMRRAALFSALSEKFGQKQIMVVDKITFDTPKAKQMKQVLADLKTERSVLIVTAGKDEGLSRSSRNLPEVKLMEARVLHPYEILRYRTIVLLQDSVRVIEETFGQAGKAKSRSQEKVAPGSKPASNKEVAAPAKASSTRKAKE